MSKLGVSLTLALLLGATVATAQDLHIGESCDLAHPGGEDKESFLQFDRELRVALSKQDPVIMSLLVGFPLRVNGERGTIEISNAAALQARFQYIFPSAIRSAVLNQPLESVWCNYYAIKYGRGNLWVGVTMEGRYEVIAINLPHSQGAIREFPKLDFVCDAEEHRVVVDLNFEGTPRYRAWNKPRPLTEPPDLEIEAGTKDHHGTGPCRHPGWTFRVGEAEYALYGHGCSSESDPAPERSRGWLEVKAGPKTQHWWCY